MLKKVQFKNKYDLKLCGVVHIPKRFDTAVVFLHGFPGRMSGTAKRFCTALSKLGYLCLRFNFSCTDTSEGKFEDKLMSEEVEDIRYAINFLSRNYDFNKLILMGISTGSIDATLYAHKDNRIAKLVLLGAEGNLKEGVRYDFTDEQVRDFWTKGYIVYNRPGKWYHKKKLKKAFYDEFFKLDVLGSLHKFKKPVLIIHGSKDEAIPVDRDPKELFKVARKPKKLIIIKNADHRFTKKTHLKQVIKHVNRFIRQNS